MAALWCPRDLLWAACCRVEGCQGSMDGSLPRLYFCKHCLHTLLPLMFFDEWLIRKIIICKLWVNQTFGPACREMAPLSRVELAASTWELCIPRPVMNLHGVPLQHVNDCCSEWLEKIIASGRSKYSVLPCHSSLVPVHYGFWLRREVSPGRYRRKGAKARFFVSFSFFGLD